MVSLDILLSQSLQCDIFFSGLEREFFLAPDGSSFSGRKQALEHMNKIGGFTIDDIRKMESGCKVKWFDDDPTLPEGNVATEGEFVCFTIFFSQVGKLEPPRSILRAARSQCSGF